MTVVLASGSPRRKQLLGLLHTDKFVVLPAEKEEIPPENAGPAETVEVLARAKAEEVAERWAGSPDCQKDDVVIAADTIVWHDNRIFGKPHSEEQAAEMLRSLSGCTHEVYTGVAVICGDHHFVEYEKTEVSFRKLEEEEIKAYVATGEPMDKAGAYGAQERGAFFVEGIKGDFYNVMGLPMCRLGLMLRKAGVKLF